MDRVPNARIRELCGDDESVLRWFGQIERWENDRIAKRVYVGECVDNRLVGRSRKRWNDSLNNCLNKQKGWCMIGILYFVFFFMV